MLAVKVKPNFNEIGVINGFSLSQPGHFKDSLTPLRSPRERSNVNVNHVGAVVRIMAIQCKCERAGKASELFPLKTTDG